MICHLVQAPKVQGAPPGKAFDVVELEFVPQAGEVMVFDGKAYQIVQRALVVDEVKRSEGEIVNLKAEVTLLLNFIGTPPMKGDGPKSSSTLIGVK